MRSVGQLLLAVALHRTHATYKSRCVSNVISMHLPGDLRQTAVSDLSKVISMSGGGEVRIGHFGSTLVIGC